MNSIKVGDVLTNGRSDRVVRNVYYNKRGQIMGVVFSIKHCSWTGRCYTHLGYNDLDYSGYRPTGVSVKLRKVMDRAILHDIVNHPKENQWLDCCDVRGMP